MKTLVTRALTLALLTTTASPCLAQENYDRDHGRGREASEPTHIPPGGGERPAYQQQESRQQPQPQVQPQAQPQAQPQPTFGGPRGTGGQDWRDRSGGRQAPVQQQVPPPRQEAPRVSPGAGQDWRGRGGAQPQQQQPAVTPRGYDDRARNDGRSDRARGWDDRGPGDRVPDRHVGRESEGRDGRRPGGDDHRWDGDRRDGRYDRNRDDSRRLPPGYYTRNWGYGDIAPRAWWGPDYRIADWWRYGLPAPAAGYEWVRVNHDALLVDRFNGRVLDVVYDLFW